MNTKFLLSFKIVSSIEQNQLIYVRNMHDRMMGFYGDRILVNGRPDFQIDVASRAYRLRVLNGSTARIYKLGWDDGTPITVIGVDGGLLEKPEVKPYVMLAPGERLDVWADFSGRNVGSQLVMRSLRFFRCVAENGRAHGRHDARQRLTGWQRLSDFHCACDQKSERQS